MQAAGAAAYPPSLAAGRPVRLPSFGTIADGIAVGCPGDVTFAHVSKLVDDVVTVTEEDISRALLVLLERGKLLAEPAGAVGVAALLAGVAGEVETPAVAVLSGGNIDPMLLLRVIEHGLAAAGRYLHVHGAVRRPARPPRQAAGRGRRAGRERRRRGPPAAGPAAAARRGGDLDVGGDPGRAPRRPAHQRPAGGRLHGDAGSREPTLSRASAGEGLELDDGHLDLGAARRGVGDGVALASAPTIAWPSADSGL